MKIITLATRADRFTDITAEIQAVLDRWDEEQLIMGEALCSVTMATAGAGLVVSDEDPGSFYYIFESFVDIFTYRFGFWIDLSRLWALRPRTSELFLVRGRQIKGGRRVYVRGRGDSGLCEIAVALVQ